MVAEYIASVKTAWELAKAVKASTDAIEDAELKLQIADLIGALADARIAAAESAERIAELEQSLKSKAEMQFDGAVYYRVENDKAKDGPFCPRCFDADTKVIRVHPGYNNTWRCQNCGQSFDKAR